MNTPNLPIENTGKADEENLASRLAAEFSAIRPTYDAFTSNIRNLIANLLDSKNIGHLAIEPRTKTIESFKAKIQRPEKQSKYTEVAQVTDLSGVRIVAYYLKDLQSIRVLIEENFVVDQENSLDKNALLAPDRFGYQSIHYIVSHNDVRKTLPENKAFAGLKAEIQIRTVLQHAWAALDRKLRYNNEEDIPREVRRKLFRVSALLEAADENFSEVDRLVSDLRVQYTTDIKVGNLDQEINIDSLEVFLREAPSVRQLLRLANGVFDVSEIDRASLSEPQTLRSFSNLVFAHVAKIKTIAQLNQAVIEFNKIAKEVFLSLSKYTNKFTTAGVIRLALAYVLPKEAAIAVLHFTPFHGELNEAIIAAVKSGSKK